MGESENPTRRRRAVFSLVLIAVFLILIEISGWAGLWILQGRPFSYKRAALERAELLEGVAELKDEDLLRAQGRKVTQGEIFWNQINHPFLGSIYLPDSDPGRISDYGFYGNESPIHQRSPDKFIVAILGGSVAQGLSMEDNESALDSLLQRLAGILQRLAMKNQPNSRRGPLPRLRSAE